ncbi:MAG: YihY/virulence factor BrkB family protein [Thermomicrobium sp.]|nr:YihY/virulence factor BrkB family protein [Thermomicrobium sp.]MDW8005632.1 YihY/virulence factor BrkB family protein [Thermomicrobium sp.]
MRTADRWRLDLLRERLDHALLWRAFLHFRAHGGSVHAAAIAYSALLALGPFLLALATVAGFLLRGTAQLDAVVERLLAEVPQAAPLEPELRRILTRQAQAASGPLAVASALLAVWSSSALGAALRRGLRAVAAPQRPGSLVRERLYGIGTTLGALLLAIVWLTAGGIASGLAVALPGPVRLASGLATSFVLFLLVYRFLLPEPPSSWRILGSGALTSAVAWEATKFVITAAARWFGGGSEVYGLLGAVTGALVAANLVAAITLYGAALIATAAECRFSSAERSA